MPEWAVKAFDQFVSDLVGWLDEQHDEDGAHTNVTAESLVVSGDTELQGSINSLHIVDQYDLAGYPTPFEPEVDIRPIVLDSENQYYAYPTIGSSSAARTAVEVDFPQ